MSALNKIPGLTREEVERLVRKYGTPVKPPKPKPADYSGCRFVRFIKKGATV